jgi:hypothetical protein
MSSQPSASDTKRAHDRGSSALICGFSDSQYGFQRVLQTTQNIRRIVVFVEKNDSNFRRHTYSVISRAVTQHNSSVDPTVSISCGECVHLETDSTVEQWDSSSSVSASLLCLCGNCEDASKTSSNDSESIDIELIPSTLFIVAASASRNSPNFVGRVARPFVHSAIKSMMTLKRRFMIVLYDEDADQQLLTHVQEQPGVYLDLWSISAPSGNANQHSPSGGGHLPHPIWIVDVPASPCMCTHDKCTIASVLFMIVVIAVIALVVTGVI